MNRIQLDWVSTPMVVTILLAATHLLRVAVAAASAKAGSNI
jgi:hypothetical protein